MHSSLIKSKQQNETFRNSSRLLQVEFCALSNRWAKLHPTWLCSLIWCTYSIPPFILTPHTHVKPTANPNILIPTFSTKVVSPSSSCHPLSHVTRFQGRRRRGPNAPPHRRKMTSPLTIPMQFANGHSVGYGKTLTTNHPMCHEQPPYLPCTSIYPRCHHPHRFSGCRRSHRRLPHNDITLAPPPYTINPSHFLLPFPHRWEASPFAVGREPPTSPPFHHVTTTSTLPYTSWLNLYHLRGSLMSTIRHHRHHPPLLPVPTSNTSIFQAILPLDGASIASLLPSSSTSAPFLVNPNTLPMSYPLCCLH